MLGHGADPIPTTVDRFDVSSPHQVAFIGPSFGKRTVVLGSSFGDRSVGTVGSTAKKDSIGAAIEAVSKWGYPTDAVAREKKQADTTIPHGLDRTILTNIPVFIVTDTDETAGFEPTFWAEHIAIATVRNVITLLFEPVC
jgi:hypothetical protein